MTLHTYTPYPMSLQSINFLHLQFLRYNPDNIFKLKVTAARSKVKSRSHHDIAHLHPLTNVPTKYQLRTPYGFRDIARTRFYRSRSLQQGQIKVRPWRCTPTPSNQCVLTSINFLHLTVLRQSPDKLFPKASPPAHPDTMGENNTLTALKGCGVKKIMVLHSKNKASRKGYKGEC